MNVMKFLLLTIISVGIFSCTNKKEPGRFSVTGDIKNAEDQKIYLEHVFQPAKS